MNDDVNNRPYDIPTGKRILTICILTFLRLWHWSKVGLQLGLGLAIMHSVPSGNRLDGLLEKSFDFSTNRRHVILSYIYWVSDRVLVTVV